MLLAFAKNWKLIVAIGVAGSLFISGWFVNGWRLEAKYAKTQQAVILKYEEQQKALNAQYAEQLERDTTARAALSQQLRQTRSKAAGLSRELESLQLSPTSPVIETVLVPGECVDGQTKAEVVLANPFSDDFIRLWNSSASGIIAGSPTPPPAD